MLAYLDSSVLLRFILKEKDRLQEFEQISYAISSELIRVECFRTLDRFRLRNALSEDDYVLRLNLINSTVSDFELIQISPTVLGRSSQPFPVALGTLDAIHLSSCLLFREKTGKDVVLCTHDESLMKAASALGIPTLGC